jgi:AraC-like DNA-binding protein
MNPDRTTLGTLIERPQRTHFDVQGQPVKQQLLAWRGRVSHVIDVVPSLAQIELPFHASIERYRIDDRMFTDCTSDSLLLERTLPRISTDNHRDFVFQVFTRGCIETLDGLGLGHRQNVGASILVTDLDQPLQMLRSTCRVLSFFVPQPIVEAALPHADALHGRVFDSCTPLVGLLLEQVSAFRRCLPYLDVAQAKAAFDTCVQLLLAAFGKQAKLSGSARAAVRRSMFDRARRYVQSNLHQSSLSPDSVLAALQLPRHTVYRLFEHEGGLATYIRNRRLREAADELVRFPDIPVIEIAYGLGFNSASDFTRAFRRGFGLPPQDLRMTTALGDLSIADVILD